MCMANIFYCKQARPVCCYVLCISRLSYLDNNNNKKVLVVLLVTLCDIFDSKLYLLE